MKVNISNGFERHLANAGNALFHLFGYSIVLATLGLSLWAVTSVQLMSRPPEDLTRWWYAAVFFICELWVALGLTLMLRQFQNRAWLSAALALIVWIPALGLSALQESRFHIMLDQKLEAARTPDLVQHEHATARIAELTKALSAMTPPRRSQTAVSAELQRYQQQPNTYRTRIANLTAELADAQAYQRLIAQIDAQRTIEQSTAKLAKEDITPKKLSQSFTVPWLKWEVSDQATIWLLIGWMMLVKAVGLHLLIGTPTSPSAKKTTPNQKQKAPIRIL